MPSEGARTKFAIPAIRSNQYSSFHSRFNDLLPEAVDFSCFFPPDGEDADEVFTDPPVASCLESGGQYEQCLCSEIERHVCGLRPLLREVYDLHIRQEWTQAEVAAAMGVSQQRVANLKSELIGSIKKFVGDIH